MTYYLKRIICKLRGIVQKVIKEIWYVFYTEDNIGNGEKYIHKDIWREFSDLLEKNHNAKYHLETIDCNKSGEFKWVGGVIRDNKIYGIPSGETCFLEYECCSEKISYLGGLSDGNVKWSGGCLYNGNIYGFPRSSNNLVILPNKIGQNPFEFPLKTVYKGEHHYGGVCTGEGIVYQPPRNANNILKIDLNTNLITEIPIGRKKRRLRYCGSIQHPNGLIYMFPEKNERVMVLDPKTDKIQFIGKQITSMVFGACVYSDGNIYGYSAYGKGMIKVEVEKNKVYRMFKKQTFGAYGTMIGINGHIMGVPGDGDCIFDFDVETNSLSIVAKIEERGKAKCAGASMDSKGNIYCIPAFGNKIYKLCPSVNVDISEKLLYSPLLNGNY